MGKKIDDVKLDGVRRIIAFVDESAEMKRVAEKALILAKDIGKEVVALYLVDTHV